MSKLPKEYPLEFSFKTAVYPKEALVSAAYMFLDKYYIFLDGGQGGKIKVMIKGKNNERWDEKKIAKIKGEFLNTLLYNTARLEVAKRNKRLREFIVGRALFSAVENLEPETGENADDPLGIAMPWEKKSRPRKAKKR
jgi:His-Xaa-Ser system protein HxsD